LRLNRGDNTIATETKVRVAVGLAFAFIVLNVADILLTWQCLQLGAIELNFIMSSVLQLGFFPSISFKLGISSGIAAIMLHRGQFSWLIIAVSMFSFVCALNIITLANLW
jgi:hypothetical protein